MGYSSLEKIKTFLKTKRTLERQLIRGRLSEEAYEDWLKKNRPTRGDFVITADDWTSARALLDEFELKQSALQELVAAGIVEQSELDEWSQHDKIKCGLCGHEGKVEAHHNVNVVPDSKIFQILGKASSTGYIHFRCPSCNGDLAVDPLKVFRGGQMVGYPSSAFSHRRAGKSRRYVPVISGAICVIVALFIFYKFSGVWTYIAAGLLLMLGWGSTKTGPFASDKEIRELTEPGPVSEDTKKKFQK